MFLNVDTYKLSPEKLARVDRLNLRTPRKILGIKSIDGNLGEVSRVRVSIKISDL